jgi:hypothetical protein
MRAKLTTKTSSTLAKSSRHSSQLSSHRPGWRAFLPAIIRSKSGGRSLGLVRVWGRPREPP